jgi:D-glycero-D-manno-heptose 1,7-bisphosphate phosphatase
VVRGCVLLDRDGVINHDSPDYILAATQWHPIDGSLEAIATLNAAGLTVAICSNQSAVGRGMLTPTTLQAIHDRMHAALAAVGGHLDGVFICPHAPDADCPCRKPRPGLLQQALEQLACPPERALMIGDSRRDLIAAEQVKIEGWLVQTGNGAALADDVRPSTPVYPDLATAVPAILHRLPPIHEVAP